MTPLRQDGLVHFDSAYGSRLIPILLELDGDTPPVAIDITSMIKRGGSEALLLWGQQMQSEGAFLKMHNGVTSYLDVDIVSN